MTESVDILITAKEIEDRLDALAEQIRADYEGKTITMVCALKGAVIFMTDLARRLNGNVEFDFVKVSSYGSNATAPSGSVRLDVPLAIDATGRDILLVEDIADSGHTLVFLRKYFEILNPASFKICVLLDKPDRRIAHSASFDYLGFSIPDEFVVGYGLDYDHRYRNLPYIGILRFTGDY